LVLILPDDSTRLSSNIADLRVVSPLANELVGLYDI